MAEITAAQKLILTPTEMQARWYYEREKLRFFPSFALLGANGQGRTREECRESLWQAISLILEDRRQAAITE